MSDKDYWKKVYEQAEPKAVKYLHADGTIDENSGSGGGGGDSVTLYAWKHPDWAIYCYTYIENPNVGETVVGCYYGDMSSELYIRENAITAVGENQITIDVSGLYAGDYIRDSTKDIVLQ